MFDGNTPSQSFIKGTKLKIITKDKKCSILSPGKTLLTSLSKHSVQISRGKVTGPCQGGGEFSFHEDRRRLLEID